MGPITIYEISILINIHYQFDIYGSNYNALHKLKDLELITSASPRAADLTKKGKEFLQKLTQVPV